MMPTTQNLKVVYAYAVFFKTFKLSVFFRTEKQVVIRIELEVRGSATPKMFLCEIKTKNGTSKAFRIMVQ